jgi:hypothetical protein
LLLYSIFCFLDIIHAYYVTERYRSQADTSSVLHSPSMSNLTTSSKDMHLLSLGQQLFDRTSLTSEEFGRLSVDNKLI